MFTLIIDLMQNNYDYPLGSDTSDAPWNYEPQPLHEIEVTVSITMSKTVKVLVDDYKVEKMQDEDGSYYDYIDYSECDIKSAVEDQICLPNESAIYVEKYASKAGCITVPEIKDLSSWNVDEFEVVRE